jgi:hypothetical protein
MKYEMQNTMKGSEGLTEPYFHCRTIMRFLRRRATMLATAARFAEAS